MLNAEFCDRILRDEWLVKKKISSGAFGEVFTSINIATLDLAAIKVNKTTEDKLTHEARIITECQEGVGFSHLFWFGECSSSKSYTFLCIEKLGPSMEKLFSLCKYQFSLKTVIMLFDQILNRIEFLHNKNYLHRDIKPSNLLMGLNKRSHIIYLIDFG